MAKRLYDALMMELEKVLNETELELISVGQGVKKYEDGSEEEFTRVEVEIPKGNAAFSRCRFTCKLSPIELGLSEEEIDEGIHVILSGVKVSYISDKKVIYTKADGIRIAP